jgi:hypothetical protein
VVDEIASAPSDPLCTLCRITGCDMRVQKVLGWNAIRENILNCSNEYHCCGVIMVHRLVGYCCVCSE